MSSFRAVKCITHRTKINLIQEPNRPRSRNLRSQRRATDLGLGVLTDRSTTMSNSNIMNTNSSPPTNSCTSVSVPTSYHRSDFFSEPPSSTTGSFPSSSSGGTSTSDESNSYPFPHVGRLAPVCHSSNGTNPFRTMGPNIVQNHAVLIPLPPQNPSELSLLATPTTPTLMEATESDGHFFGAEPLEVEDGVAVMEEGVGLHVPDVLITQY